MRYLIALAAALFAFSGAHATDLFAPKPKPEPELVSQFKAWNGCYVEASYARAAYEVDAISVNNDHVGVGGGCDLQLMPSIIAGALVRYDFADDKLLSFSGRVGYAVNPYLLGYGFTSLALDGDAPSLNDGILSLGLGAETFLVSSNVTIFAEASRNVATFGDLGDIDEATLFRFGVRYRFGDAAF